MSISTIDFSARLVFALCSFSLLAVIIALIRKNAIKEKYVLLWIPLGAGLFFASLFPDLLVMISARIQLHYITVVLLGVIVVFTGILLYFTTKLSQLREDVKKLAQEIALTGNHQRPEVSQIKKVETNWIPGKNF